jgi:hypothetical protein
MASRIALLLLLLVPLVATTQQIFKTTDENGNVVFTDQPPPGAEAVEEVELQQINRAAPPPEMERPLDKLEPAEETIVQTVSITAPANETTIPMGPGNFAVSARVEPGLQSGETLLLQIDGEPWGQPDTGNTWQLTNIFRGAHDLTVAVIAPDGSPLAISDPVRVYVLRPSVNFRN